MKKRMKKVAMGLVVIMGVVALGLITISPDHIDPPTGTIFQILK